MPRSSAILRDFVEKPKKKSRKLPHTPYSQIKGMCRTLWLRSRERNAALKRESHTCQHCHRKASKAKGKEFSVEVHHQNEIDWIALVEHIRRVLLVHPDLLTVLCPHCHDGLHGRVRKVKPIAKGGAKR